MCINAHIFELVNVDSVFSAPAPAWKGIRKKLAISGVLM